MALIVIGCLMEIYGVGSSCAPGSVTPTYFHYYSFCLSRLFALVIYGAQVVSAERLELMCACVYERGGEGAIDCLHLCVYFALRVCRCIILCAFPLQRWKVRLESVYSYFLQLDVTTHSFSRTLSPFSVIVTPL